MRTQSSVEATARTILDTYHQVCDAPADRVRLMFKTAEENHKASAFNSFLEKFKDLLQGG